MKTRISFMFFTICQSVEAQKIGFFVVLFCLFDFCCLFILVLCGSTGAGAILARARAYSDAEGTATGYVGQQKLPHHARIMMQVYVLENRTQLVFSCRLTRISTSFRVEKHFPTFFLPKVLVSDSGTKFVLKPKWNNNFVPKFFTRSVGARKRDLQDQRSGQMWKDRLTDPPSQNYKFSSPSRFLKSAQGPTRRNFHQQYAKWAKKVKLQKIRKSLAV